MRRIKIKRAVVSLSLSIFILSLIVTGCGKDSDITGAGNVGENTSSEDSERRNPNKDTTTVWFDLSLRFKNENIRDSRFLDSHNGSQFNHIAYLNQGIEPGEEIDLQELQPFGIFALYISSEGMFTLANSDGISISAKSIFLERCSFIDLKLINSDLKSIKVTGFVAGE